MATIKQGVYKFKQAPALLQPDYYLGAAPGETTISAKPASETNISPMIVIESGDTTTTPLTQFDGETACNICVKAEDDTIYYFTGEVENNHLLTTNNIDNAMDVYVMAGTELFDIVIMFTVNETQMFIKLTPNGEITLASTEDETAFEVGCAPIGEDNWGINKHLIQELNFGNELLGELTTIAITCMGVFYYIPPDGENEGEYFPAFMSAFGQSMWQYSQLRRIYVLEDQPVADEFITWMEANLQPPPPEEERINFTINGETYQAAKDTNWNLWSLGALASGPFGISNEQFLTYNGFLISYNGQPVNMWDFIIEDAEYQIEKQVLVYITAPEEVYFNQLFTHIGNGGWSLKSNQTYNIPLTCKPEYYITPQALTSLNSYIDYELKAEELVITVKDIPDNFLEIETATIRLGECVSQKRLEKFVDTYVETNNDNATFVNLAPQYRVNIEGPLYLEYNDGGLSHTIGGYEGKSAHGALLTDTLLEQYEQELNSVVGGPMDEPSVHMLCGLPADQVTYDTKVYLMGTWFIDYLNKEMSSTDILGKTIYVFDKDEDVIKNGYLEARAAEDGVTVEELIATLESEAAAAEQTYDEYLKSLIVTKAEVDSFDKVRWFYKTVWDENIVAAFEELFAARKINVIQPEPFDPRIAAFGVEILTLYGMNDTTEAIKYVFSGSDTHNVVYAVDNNGETIKTDVIFSDENNFNISGECTIDDYEYLRIDSYNPPIDRYTPGILKMHTEYCLSGDTLIELKDGNFKRLDEIQLGDEVRTPTGYEKVIFSDAAGRKIKDRYTTYYFNDGSKLRVIKDHRVYSPKRRKFVHISTLKIGDEIIKADGTRARLLDKELTCQDMAHYTLYTENTNKYYANGILCGNIFSNIKIGFVRRALLKLYKQIFMKKELELYEELKRNNLN